MIDGSSSAAARPRDRGPRICLIGAGGMSFGPSMVIDAIRSTRLSGTTLALHDVDPARLERVTRMAHRLNAAHGSPVRIESSVEPAVAMPGADFCLVSTEVGRFRYWKQDYEIPNRYGATQINGENGGPGAVFHALRAIRTVLGICADLERHCPDTFLINLTNPMSRVTQAIARATRLRSVGLCHEFRIGVTRLGLLLRVPSRKIAARAAGINHFTFFTEIRHADTGEDLYPRVRQLWARRFFDYPPAVTWLARQVARHPVGAFAVEQIHTPLVRHMFRSYGLLPCSVDSHIGEYVPFACEVSGWHPAPVDMHRRLMGMFERISAAYGEGRSRLPLHRLGRTGEESFPLIEGLWTGERTALDAVNVPNRGYIPNLPEGAIVEVPACTGAGRIEPATVEPLPEPLAEIMRRQIAIVDLVVDAALGGDPEKALEAIRRDPNSPPDERACRAIFGELRSLQAEALPFSRGAGSREPGGAARDGEATARAD